MPNYLITDQFDNELADGVPEHAVNARCLELSRKINGPVYYVDENNPDDAGSVFPDVDEDCDTEEERRADYLNDLAKDEAYDR